jgi:AmmeMemoRadiSam system protein A
MTSADERLPLLAVDAIAHALRTGERRVPEPSELGPELTRPAATFVTLERDGELLGCIGSLIADLPLGVSVAQHALSAAFDDPRLPPVTPDDFPWMTVKVSVLSEPQPLTVASYEALARTLAATRSGVVVERGRRRATFLPAVWAKLPDVDSFLDSLWAKAGLPPRLWDARVLVSTYTTEELIDPAPRAPLSSARRVG